MPTLLEVDLTAPLLEIPPADPVEAFLARRRGQLRDVVDGLRLAAADPDVVGLVAHLGPAGPRLAQAEELREAVGRLGAAGKSTLAWTESFGELGPGTAPYYLATAFGEIWLQPSGDVGLTGVAIDALFVRSALDRAGVEPQLDQRYEYKNAADMFLRSQLGEAQREAMTRLAGSAMEQVVGQVAERRRLTAQAVRELVDRAPIPAEEAQAAGLVDRLGYRDEAYAELRRRAGGNVRLRFVHRYRQAKLRDPHALLARLGPPARAPQPVVALAHALGPIHLGRSRRGPLRRPSTGSESLTAALRSATASPHVAAVVLRVDSPGGSYVASDAIRREVVRLRDSGKPVIVSMGRVAASGGYFVSMAADTIVALPTTLTGSIGVLGGKMVVRGLADRLGVVRDGAADGAHARMFSSNRPFDESEWQRLQQWLDRVYDDFTAKVAADRRLSREHVHDVARGRVWTGTDAQARGLVDELGGLEAAIRLACERTGLDRATVQLRGLPHLKVADRIRPPDSSEDPAAAAAAGSGGPAGGLWSASVPGSPLTALLGLVAEWYGLPAPPAGVLAMPQVWELG